MEAHAGTDRTGTGPHPFRIALAAIAYAAFLAVLAWAIGFLADAATPTTVDGGRPMAWWWLIDAALLGLFAVQHSVMARATVKRALRLPPWLERTVFVFASTAVLALLFSAWAPEPTVIWQVGGAVAGAIWAVFGLGWAIALAATFMVDHWDFVGLRQARGRRAEPRFAERWMYAWVRHPMMLGLLIAFWATPHMTVGHAYFALAATGYIVVGLRLEERDLRARLGPVYTEYAERVPAVLPTPRGRWRVRVGEWVRDRVSA